MHEQEPLGHDDVVAAHAMMMSVGGGNDTDYDFVMRLNGDVVFNTKSTSSALSATHAAHRNSFGGHQVGPMAEGRSGRGRHNPQKQRGILVGYCRMLSKLQHLIACHLHHTHRLLHRLRRHYHLHPVNHHHRHIPLIIVFFHPVPCPCSSYVSHDIVTSITTVVFIRDIRPSYVARDGQNIIIKTKTQQHQQKQITASSSSLGLNNTDEMKFSNTPSHHHQHDTQQQQHIRHLHRHHHQTTMFHLILFRFRLLRRPRLPCPHTVSTLQRIQNSTDTSLRCPLFLSLFILPPTLPRLNCSGVCR